MDSKPRLSLWWKLPFAAAFILLVVIVCLVLLDRAATRRWQRYAAKLRSEGQALTFQEIEAQIPAVPLRGTVASLLTQLSPELTELSSSDLPSDILVIGKGNDYVDFFAGLQRKSVDASRKFLAQHDDLFQKLAAIHDLHTGRFLLAYAANPMDTLLPHLSYVRRAARLQYLRGIIGVCDNRLSDSMMAVHAILDISNTLRFDQVLISVLRHERLNVDAVMLTEGILRAGVVDATLLSELQDRLDDVIKKTSLSRGIQGERAVFVELCDALIAGDVTLACLNETIAGLGRNPFPVWARDATIRENQVMGTMLLTEYVKVGKTRPELLAAIRQIESHAQALDGSYFLVKKFVVPFARGKSIDRHFAYVALLRCAKLGLAAERFRLAMGRFPAALDELAPDYIDEIPLDPFTEELPRLVANESGIEIYSVGPNGTDDGGDVTMTGWERNSKDVGFRLLSLDHRGVLLIDEPDEGK